VPRTSGPVFMFCAPELIFGGAECVCSCFHVLLARNYFRRYRGCLVPFSCFVPPDSFSTVSTASGPVFIFCVTGVVFGGNEGVGSRFYVLRTRTVFRRYRVRRVPYSCFSRPDSYSALPRASGPVFMFCAPGLVFGSTVGVGSRFHILRARTRFRRYGGRQVSSSCLRSRSRFQRYRGHRVRFSCFACSDRFSTEPRASGHRFHVLRSRTHFRRYRGRRVPFSCFVLLDSFSAVPRAAGPVLVFCAPGIIFDGTEGVGSRFHVLRARTCFQQYRGHWVPFSCFGLPDSFWEVPSALGPVFMF
jgi:hypothetical protein